jgi:glycosyltransferase involved in cell wall biosynthesis
MQKINWIILASKDRGIDYGVGTFIKQLSKELAKQKHVSVFILEIGLTQSKTFSIKRQDGITIVEVPVAENKTGTDTKKNQEKLSRNIARVVSQYIPMGNDNVIHMNYLFQYFFATALKEIVSGKIIFTQHVFTMEQQLEENYFDTEFETYNTVDKIITVTRHGKNHLMGKGVNAGKIEIIYNGIDPNCFKYNPRNGIKEKYGLPRNEKLILYSGRIDPIKGLDYLCLAMERLIKKVPDCRLVIAGDGDFKSLIQSAGKFSANISFLGFIPFDDVVALYFEADMGVIPSLEEHCSYVALEMLFCGLPVVASGLGGLKEIFTHNENALLVDTVMDKTNLYGIAPKVEQLEDYLFKLLTGEPLRTKFSRNAKKRADSMFTADIMINNYLQTIKNVNQNAKE